MKYCAAIVVGALSFNDLRPASSVYSPFSDRVGLPPQNIPSPRLLMKSIGAEFFSTTGCPSWRQPQRISSCHQQTFSLITLTSSVPYLILIMYYSNNVHSELMSLKSIHNNCLKLIVLYLGGSVCHIRGLNIEDCSIPSEQTAPYHLSVYVPGVKVYQLY